ncbi:MAG: PEP-CTERM sorting domain-containing protein [Marinobacter sp.]|nr:PEP-CTERM sorting domain-containing protein [Marinobacter sp.]
MMKQTRIAVALSTVLAMGAMSANATMIVFDGNNGGTAKAGTVETATADNSGNPDRWGSILGFSDFSVSGGRSSGDNLNNGTFNRNNITSFNVDQDLSPNHGGLGVCSENASCGGDSDSFASNFGNDPGKDEVLFFDFNNAVTLDTIWFNGDHKEHVDGSTTNSVTDPANALFNIFFSTNGTDYTNLFSNQVRPTDLEYITTALSESYQYYAVAASGWGPHMSYVEALSYTVPEPGTLSLLGLGLIGLGFARRQQKA